MWKGVIKDRRRAARAKMLLFRRPAPAGAAAAALGGSAAGAGEARAAACAFTVNRFAQRRRGGHAGHDVYLSAIHNQPKTSSPALATFERQAVLMLAALLDDRDARISQGRCQEAFVRFVAADPANFLWQHSYTLVLRVDVRSGRPLGAPSRSSFRSPVDTKGGWAITIISEMMVLKRGVAVGIFGVCAECFSLSAAEAACGAPLRETCVSSRCTLLLQALISHTRL